VGRLKVKISDYIEEFFRRKVSQRRGIRKGSLSAAVESAITKYSGLDPKLSVSAIVDSLIIDGEPKLVLEVLSKILPLKIFTIYLSSELLREKNLQPVNISEENGYAIFKASKREFLNMLKHIKSLRAEFNGNELVCEEGCVVITLKDFDSAKNLLLRVAECLKIKIPEVHATKRLEIYMWSNENIEVVFE